MSHIFEDEIEGLLAKVLGQHSHLSEIAPVAIALSQKCGSLKELSQYFFDHESYASTKLDHGVVETPAAVAAFIVKLTHTRWESNSSSAKSQNEACSWFDPCGGGGAFPVEIIKYYVEELGADTPEDLPCITISEISKAGVASTFLSVLLVLDQLDISPTHYVNLGRFKIHWGDTLIRYPQKQDFFSSADEFDIIVGNPPYVRASRLTKEYKSKLSENFSNVFLANADLYTYFVASGVCSLAINGVLGFIAPATFIRAKNGIALRNFLLLNASLDTFIDLDETKVFENADLHASIFVLRNKQPFGATSSHLHISTPTQFEQLLSGDLQPSKVVVSSAKERGWSFHPSFKSLRQFSEIFEGCVGMQDMGLTVYSGIRPGHSAAFVLNQEKYESFSQAARDKWIKPLVLPSDLIRWTGQKKISYILMIPSKCEFIDDEIYSYLLPFKSSLKKRAEVKNGRHWFTLRPCSYYDKMEKRKIAFPDLSAQQRFSIVDSGVYVPDGAYFLDTSNLVVLGILNSSVAKEYFVNRCSSVGNLSAGGRFRFKKEFVKNFPLPRNCLSSGTIQRDVERLVSEFLLTGESEGKKEELDSLVDEMYRSKKLESPGGVLAR